MAVIHFAPLQGYTDSVYREAHTRVFGGVDTYYTPFVRIEKGGFRNKDLKDIACDRNRQVHVVPQLIASTPDEFRPIVRLFQENGYKEADINLGCLSLCRSVRIEARDFCGTRKRPSLYYVRLRSSRIFLFL